MNLNKAKASSLENVAQLETILKSTLSRGLGVGNRPTLDEKIEAVRRVHRDLRAERRQKK